MFTFTAASPDFLAAITKVQAAVETKSTIPVLANVLITVVASSQRASVIGTDLDISSQTTFAVQATDSGTMTIPAKKLLEILRELPDAPVTVTVDDKSWVRVDCGKSTFRIAGLPCDDFPLPPTEQFFSGAVPVTLPGPTLFALLDATLLAVSHDESRHALCGVNFDFDGGLTAVATDGHRLAMCTVAVETAEIGNIIIPLKGAVELKRFCGESDVTLFWDAKSLLASDGVSTLCVRLLDGSYPDYRALLKANQPTSTVNIPLAEFQQALRRVSLLSGDTRLVKLSFVADSLTLSATSKDTGEATDSLACQYTGEPVAIGANAKFLLDALHAVSGETVTLGLSDALSPIVITCAEAARKQIIMPMRL